MRDFDSDAVLGVVEQLLQEMMRLGDKGASIDVREVDCLSAADAMSHGQLLRTHQDWVVSHARTLASAMQALREHGGEKAVNQFLSELLDAPLAEGDHAN